MVAPEYKFVFTGWKTMEPEFGWKGWQEAQATNAGPMIMKARSMGPTTFTLNAVQQRMAAAFVDRLMTPSPFFERLKAKGNQRYGG